jgi:hypothetical protein
VGEESSPNLIRTADLETMVAILQNKAEQMEVRLPRDAALYIAENVRSNEREFELALLRLAAHSSLTGTAITLTYTQRVLKNFIDAQAREGPADPLPKLPSQPFGTNEAKLRRQHALSAGRHLVFLPESQDWGKASRVRHKLEVNMRESERERLARRDAYERELERRANKRKQG